MNRVPILCAVLLLGWLAPQSVHSQSRWVASVQGGYGTEVSTFGEGSWALRASIYQRPATSEGVDFGFELGHYRHGAPRLSVSDVLYFTPDPHTICGGPQLCEGTPFVRHDERVDWSWHVGVMARLQRREGPIHPFGVLGLGVYTFDVLHTGEARNAETDEPIPVLSFDDGSAPLSTPALGLSVGGGVEVPLGGRILLSAEGRAHAAAGYDWEHGRSAGNRSFVVFSAGLAVKM